MRASQALAIIPILLAGTASAQTTRSVLLPPNPIDRATAASDARNADARRAAEADRLSASVAAREAASQSGEVAGSTMTDGVAGTGTNPIDAPPPRTVIPPRP